MVSQLMFGEPVVIDEHLGNWMKVTTIYDNYTGYVDSKHIRTYSEEAHKNWLNDLTFQSEIIKKIKGPNGEMWITRGAFITKFNSSNFSVGRDNYLYDSNDENESFDILEIASDYINSPYLWGGKSPFGIDCSGFTQTIFRLLKIELPRDAYQQFDLGTSVDFGSIEKGDLAFFKSTEGKIIHVGICDGDGRIIHASGWVRWDKLMLEGIIHHELSIKTHTLAGIKRLIK
jgi:hypothetical protein